MQKLVQGIHKFQKDVFGSRKELFERLAFGQSPEALFITCSDSRINPNLLTQTEPGELFIIRNAGNIIPPHDSGDVGEEATIEFAVKGLGVRDIIVCGHSHCGAVHGLLKPDSVADLPAMRSWLRHAEKTAQIMRENYPHLEGEALLTATVEENVLVQLEHLRNLPAVAEKVTRGELALHAWVYKIETGEVFAYDSAEGQYVPLSGIRFAPAVPRAVSSEAS